MKNFIQSGKAKLLAAAIPFMGAGARAHATGDVSALDPSQVPELNEIVNTTKSLIMLVTSWATGIATLVCVVMLVIAGIQYTVSDDEGVKAHKKRFIRQILVGFVVSGLASVIVQTLKGLYGRTA